MKTIYVDNNATTAVAPEVLDAMMPYLTELYGNPSSTHSFGGNVEHAIKAAREQVAALIGASPEEIIFTSCGTESDNTAIQAAISANPDKKHIVTTRVEHPAIKNMYEHLSKQGFRVTFVPVDRKGRLDMDFLYDSLTEGTALVSVMWANNESGVIFPINEISHEVRSRGIAFHTDAVQAAGKTPINVADTGADLLSLSGHKIHAPKGIGILYIRRGVAFSPFLIGGHQERGRRGGTENVASIVGIGKACELAKTNLDEMDTRVRYLRDKLEQGLLDGTPKSTVNGIREQRLPSTTSIGFDAVEGEAILLMMDALGICASSGSACTSGSLEPSHVLRAMGVPFTSAHGSIRFSLSHYNTEEEIDFIVEKLPPIIANLRKMSPFWDGGSA
ncbi:cysteine desulfurase NifS [Desulfococcaceae bacterium HSG9]|nr:cysteine desulfurase NifS [Desulfococcaceae bacterium HSG9]